MEKLETPTLPAEVLEAMARAAHKRCERKVIDCYHIEDMQAALAVLPEHGLEVRVINEGTAIDAAEIRTLRDQRDYAIGEHARAKTEIARLREALGAYGRHDMNCEGRQGKERYSAMEKRHTVPADLEERLASHRRRLVALEAAVERIENWAPVNLDVAKEAPGR